MRLSKEAVQSIHDDLWHGHANVDYSTDMRTEAKTVDALCRTTLALYEEVEGLKKKLCVHDQETLDRARDDSGYF